MRLTDSSSARQSSIRCRTKWKSSAKKSSYGNGTAIFTNSGKAAREFKNRVKAGMVGINVGVPATMAMFPFTGWDESFYGDLHIQGKEGVQFYTQQKVVTTRWFGEGVGDVWKKERMALLIKGGEIVTGTEHYIGDIY